MRVGKLICLLITVITTVVLLGLSIFLIIEAVTLETKINDVLDVYGTGGIPITRPITGNYTLVVQGKATPNHVIAYRWDHPEGEKNFSNVAAHVLPTEDDQYPPVGLCSVQLTEPPTLEQCIANSEIGTKWSRAGVCPRGKGSVYIGVYSTVPSETEYTMELLWSAKKSDYKWCSIRRYVKGIMVTFGLTGIFMALGLSLCCMVVSCGLSMYLTYRIRKYQEYQQVPFE